MPQRYFIDSIKNEITGQDAHHIKRVMRMKIGDQIIVCNQGQCFLSSITSIDECVTFETLTALKQSQSIIVSIIQGLPKHPKSEFIAKYATMFGATELIFVEMDRSISKLENSTNKSNRLHLIAKEASELSHLFSVPKIDLVKQLSQIDFKKFDIVFFADELETQSILTDFDILGFKNKHVAVIVGPEGGISDQERKYFIEQKATPISLGKRILPTEAACLYILSHLAREIE
jgi:16S rRNA (uracil1498-N3)-methyltransferase